MILPICQFARKSKICQQGPIYYLQNYVKLSVSKTKLRDLFAILYFHNSMKKLLERIGSIYSKKSLCIRQFMIIWCKEITYRQEKCLFSIFSLPQKGASLWDFSIKLHDSICNHYYLLLRSDVLLEILLETGRQR